ncbi:Fasciclin-like arabinogalactan protein [Melia azedarach]|uniref:Fasciclin-like arabinogalactan protein n=1 Tax=Melia azedarach TaxID=155640 RepID=A0ACC1YRB7_MELAZ|nr:Fasciclin-like arabinogalactan protein [Melia azedarach]
MTMRQAFCSFTLILAFLLHCTKILAQPAAAPAQPAGPTAAPAAPSPPTPIVLPFPADGPAQSGPTDVTKILEKAGHFTLFIRLLKSTSVIDQIEHQLNETNSGLTIFAPPDDAFSALSSGTLNSLSDGQKELLMQFHVLSSYIPLARFKTVSNPLRTNAGDNSKYAYQLNVTAHPSSLNISTGIINATASGIVYSDGQLAIYQVDKVLLPWSLFGAKPPASAPAPAPAPTKPVKQSAGTAEDDSPGDNDKKSASGAVSLRGKQNVVLVGAVVAAAAIFCS